MEYVNSLVFFRKDVTMGFGEWTFIYLGCGVIFEILFFMKDFKRFMRRENKWWSVTIGDMFGWIFIPIIVVTFWIPFSILM